LESFDEIVKKIFRIKPRQDEEQVVVL